MKPFAYVRPKTMDEARALLSAKARPKGGGIDLLDLAKAGHPVPELLVDVSRLSPELTPVALFTMEPTKQREFSIQGKPDCLRKRSARGKCSRSWQVTTVRAGSKRRTK